MKSLASVVSAVPKSAAAKSVMPKVPKLARTRKPRPAATRLKETLKFGSNPGDLRMLSYAPPGLPKKAALVVVLHGCLQNAEGFDRASGWSDLAHRHGFALLYPEQKTVNNPNRCFNWFRPSSVRRDRGEAGSVRAMIDVMCKRHRISADRIYVFGLSAGGALTTALLAAYPDVFAGGCVVAGMPFGAARDAVTAMRVMASGAQQSPKQWGDLVREASPQPPPGRWPMISIWHGSHDRVVSAANADAIVDQWLDLHGLKRASAKVRKAVQRTGWQWRDDSGRIAVEEYRFEAMDHGLPVTKARRARSSDKRYYLDVGVCAATTMTRKWELGG
ncbi:extracellular catalytic domain type 1 short-chain-length polyhydroxyalkanoate depolymerase [Rhizobium halophytocola]|uniref:Poly(Hydroxyalkanoate) depolymerase family esterase n=1 Tax=Rhizobium halophytocola TaxID=735519 RepID=A0ABS4DYE5_9HYPH|nr:PHB depolymerase family esterase [Rhizobium halophytocola]MBP1850669.1 poly(hydroxyalkanoate) depolymerase family esterase [Rhizobium halophytocola]